MTTISNFNPDWLTVTGDGVAALNGPPVSIRDELTTKERSEVANSNEVAGDSLISNVQSPLTDEEKANGVTVSEPSMMGAPQVADRTVVSLVAVS